MLTINYSIIENNALVRSRVFKTYSWKVGDDSPRDELDDDSIQILSIHADKEERSYIINKHFINLPYTNFNLKSECVWRGEFARFIFDNL